jgi:hypothetical protein
MKVATVMKILTAGCLALFLAGTAYGIEVSIGPADITLETESGRKPADFPHRQHQESYSCTACHHANEGVMTIDKCANCHNKDIDNASVNSFKKAAHSMCKDCHKKVNDEGMDAPIKCSGCHTKKK